MGVTTFIRRAKKQNNFTVLDCTVIRMDNLSWKAKGLHTYLMQLPEDWQVNLNDLKNRSRDGREATQSALNELQKAGLFERVVNREAGRFQSVEYIVHEYPIEGFTENGFPVNGESENGFPVNGESATTNNELLTNNEKLVNNELDNEPNGSNTPFPEPEKLKRKKASSVKTLFKTTFPEDGGFEKFCAAFENSEYAQNFDASLRYYFEAVRDWSAANNTMKADWIATARNFMRGDLAKNKLVTNAKLTNQNRPTGGGVDFDLARRAASEFLAKRGIQA